MILIMIYLIIGTMLTYVGLIKTMELDTNRITKIFLVTLLILNWPLVLAYIAYMGIQDSKDESKNTSK